MTGDRVAIVGCGKEKLDLEGDKGPVALARLYTSTYFELKREYAKTCCDRYYVLSAKYGIALPGKYVSESYELTLSDLDQPELEDWAAEVSDDLDLIAEDADTIVFLAGQDYQEPLVDTLNEIAERIDIEYPFWQSAGIGEQMGWLREQIDREGQTQQTRDENQPTLDTFEGRS